ncbi:hypothetical protein [Pseudoduganella violaceinigra]|uniref:hypothetical protein n=1 Tax=Pseudoduganella violaceinigra TaxID=246602 RepID=UPI00041F74DA|nr:hypothetical protein [Pseudoduganella violaceinigra]
MKQTTKAALLSGLAFPGLGQLMVLKRPKRGAAILLPALASFCWIMYGVWAATATLMEEALNGTLAPDPFAISARLHETSFVPGADTAAWILVACWLAGIIDALLLRDRP